MCILKGGFWRGYYHLIDNYYICGMGIVFKSRQETFLTRSGKTILLNKYKEFKAFIEMYNECHFAAHYKLFENQIGVYRFNWNDKPHYVGYSCNLKDRVRHSFFNHCFELDNITFQYILCESKEEAISLESYYISMLQPNENIAGVHEPYTYGKNVPQFCLPMNIHFNDYWNRIDIM